jgi:hypothetical protein
MKHNNIHATVIRLTVTVVTALTIIIPVRLLMAACPNKGASGSDNVNSQCATCACVNGNPTKWYLCSNTNACSGTVYGLTVATDISCGQGWTFVYIPTTPESGQAVTVWCESATLSGNCSCGECIGTMGPTNPEQRHLLLQSVSCTPNPCAGF